MSYETKAGVAVSCSFLCLVGVVLTSKLWEGQPANADTTAENQQGAELVGPTSPPINGAMAPESTLPNLQRPPTGENVLQQVKGPETSRPLVDMGTLFPKRGDPFQQKPLIAADAPQASSPNTAAPEFDSPPVAPLAVAIQPAPPSTPKFPLAAAEAGLADPKKVLDPKTTDDLDFAATAAALKKKAAGGETIGTGVVDLAPKAGQPAAPVIPEVKISPPPGVDSALLAAQKKAQEEAAALNGGLDPKNVAASSKDDIAKQLEKQKSLEQAAAKDPAKEVADAAFAASRQQAPIKAPDFSRDALNAGKGSQGIGNAPVVIPAMGAAQEPTSHNGLPTGQMATLARGNRIPRDGFTAHCGRGVGSASLASGKEFSARQSICATQGKSASAAKFRTAAHRHSARGQRFAHGRKSPDRTPTR